MMKIISTLLIFVPVFIFGQAQYTPVSYQNESISSFSSLKYIDDGKAAFISNGEVYEMDIDENYNFDIKYIQNSGINQDVISRHDVNNDGVKDLLTYDNKGKGLFTFISTPERFIPVSQFSTKKITSFAAQDFDDDGIDEIFINGDLYKHNPDGSLSFMIEGTDGYTYKSPYFIDIDQDGDKDVLVNIVTNIGYLENVDNKKFNLKIISKYNHSCNGLNVIETTNGPKIIYYNAGKKTINRIIPDSGSYNTKILVSDFPNYGFEMLVSDVTGDGNQEILFRTKQLDRLYTFQYNIALDTGKIIYQEFKGSKGMFVIDDRGKNKIVGVKSNGMNVYEYDEDMNFNLIASSVNNLTLNDNSFIDIDGDKFVDMVNTSYQRRYFGKDDFDIVKNLSLPDTGGKLIDFDDDGDADYVKEEIWYENLGDGVFSSAKPNPEFNPYPDPKIYFTKVIFKKDLDDDGDIDLLSYNSFGESLLLHENINNEYFKEGVELANNSIISGKLRSIKYLDLDGDGKKDILMAAASSLVWFKQESSLQFSNGIVLYNDLTVRSIDVKDGDFDGILDIVLGTGKIITATAKGQTILFKGTSSGPVLKGQIENNKGYKYPKFINSDGVGALDVIVESQDQLYIYRLSSYENLNPKLQNITNEYHNYKSFKIMDVDGDLDEDIIMYKNGGTGVSYLLKDESIPLGECPTGNITLRNKNQVNHFKTNFGHCTVIDGNLTLGNGVDWADINDLEAFKNIVEIKGYLYIDELNKIKNYLGFRNLERIRGSLIIKGLKHGNLLGFEKLKSIGGDIRLYNAFTAYNDAGDFSAFESFDSLGGSIILKYSSFSNIDDLFVNKVIYGDLILDRCTSLKAIDGLYNVDSIKGNILIRDCGSITDLNSLGNLIYFEKLDLDYLKNCSKLSFNPKLDTIKNDLTIRNLHPELTFQQNNIKYVMGNLHMTTPQIDNWHNLEYVRRNFYIAGNKVDSLSFNKLTQVDGSFVFRVKQSSDYSNFNNLRKIGYNFPIGYRSKSLNGLEKLDTIKGKCIFNKSELTDISAFKDSIFIGGKWSITDNPLLNICDVPALCYHIKAGREYEIRNNGEGCNVISDINCLDHSISGTVFYDYNENGIIDSTDASLSNVKIDFNNGNNSIITSNNGFYQKFLLEGDSFSVSTEGLEGWHFTTEKEYVIDSFIPFVTDVENLNFGLKPDADKKEIFTSVTSGFFICNRELYVDIFTKNMGTEKSSGFLKVTYSDKIRLHPDFTDFTSHNTDKREIFLEYNDLYPYSDIKSKLLFIAPGAEELENDSLIVKVEVYENNQNQQPIKVHEDFIKLHLLCSYDSNDKIVSSTDKTGNLRINEDDELIYTIRFQNTGNSYAEDIRIVDELPENLDIASFEFIDASHNVEIILKNRKLTFLFDNIFLPDSTSSFTESQGYVTFKIKSLSNELNISFLNEANVFYDYNQAVTTNKVNSIIYDPSVRLNEVRLGDIEIYPQPAMGMLYFRIKSEHSNYNYIIINQYGQQVKANQMNNSGSIKIADLSSGIYYILVFDNKNTSIFKKRLIITK